MSHTEPEEDSFFRQWEIQPEVQSWKISHLELSFACRQRNKWIYESWSSKIISETERQEWQTKGMA